MFITKHTKVMVERKLLLEIHERSTFQVYRCFKLDLSSKFLDV